MPNVVSPRPVASPSRTHYAPCSAAKKNGATHSIACPTCIPIQTHTLGAHDSIVGAAVRYVAPHLQPGDVLVVSEKALGCTQGRAIPVADISARPLAHLLARFVTKTPAGIGLGMPETMEMALRECGAVRILLAAAVGALGKLLGQRGWFYRVAGRRASSIDGPCSYTLPPYNTCVSLAPLDPDGAARELSGALGNIGVAIVDINDLGGEVLGSYRLPISDRKLMDTLRSNPLGQESQRTPFGIVR